MRDMRGEILQEYPKKYNMKELNKLTRLTCTFHKWKQGIVGYSLRTLKIEDNSMWDLGVQ